MPSFTRESGGTLHVAVVGVNRIGKVQTSKGADTINFHDPRSQADIIKPPVTGLTAENTDQVVVNVKKGTLLVFPSWLAHSVDANTSGETRISISFNIMFSAYAETASKPLW